MIWPFDFISTGLRSKAKARSRRAVLHRRPMLELLEDRIQPSGTSTITSNFNGTPIPAGSTVWFNSVAKVSGLGSSPVKLDVVNASVTFTANGVPYTLAVPNADITFSPTATTASTTLST